VNMKGHKKGFAGGIRAWAGAFGPSLVYAGVLLGIFFVLQALQKPTDSYREFLVNMIGEPQPFIYFGAAYLVLLVVVYVVALILSKIKVHFFCETIPNALRGLVRLFGMPLRGFYHLLSALLVCHGVLALLAKEDFENKVVVLLFYGFVYTLILVSFRVLEDRI